MHLGVLPDKKTRDHRLAKRCTPRHIERNLARKFHQQNSGRIKAAKHMAKHVEKQIFHRPYRLESAVTCSLDRPPQNRYYITNDLNIKPLRRYLQIQRQVHCLGCSMTKAQKSLFKSLKTNKNVPRLSALRRSNRIVLGDMTIGPTPIAQVAAKNQPKTCWPNYPR